MQKPIKHRSAKMEKVYRTRRRNLVAKLLLDRPFCQRCLQSRSQDIHELKSRARGGSITDESNLVALCRECHTWVTINPLLAKEQGWLKNSWD